VHIVGQVCERVCVAVFGDNTFACIFVSDEVLQTKKQGQFKL
jgi:hypothetical protein